jgi:hypothetical protein
VDHPLAAGLLKKVNRRRNDIRIPMAVRHDTNRF